MRRNEKQLKKQNNNQPCGEMNQDGGGVPSRKVCQNQVVTRQQDSLNCRGSRRRYNFFLYVQLNCNICFDFLGNLVLSRLLVATKGVLNRSASMDNKMDRWITI